MLTALYCQRSGSTFASVHDSFWTHAANVGVMNRVSSTGFNVYRGHNKIKFYLAKRRGAYLCCVFWARNPSLWRCLLYYYTVERDTLWGFNLQEMTNFVLNFCRQGCLEAFHLISFSYSKQTLMFFVTCLPHRFAVSSLSRSTANQYWTSCRNISMRIILVWSKLSFNAKSKDACCQINYMKCYELIKPQFKALRDLIDSSYTMLACLIMETPCEWLALVSDRNHEHCWRPWLYACLAQALSSDSLHM